MMQAAGSLPTLLQYLSRKSAAGPKLDPMTFNVIKGWPTPQQPGPQMAPVPQAGPMPKAPGAGSGKGDHSGFVQAGTLGAAAPEDYKDMSQFATMQGMLAPLNQMESLRQAAMASNQRQPRPQEQQHSWISELLRYL